MGLLDARIVAGDGALGGELVERALADWRGARAPPAATSSAKLTSERHTDVPEVAFALEPDLKRAKGGSRDVVTLGIMNRLGLDRRAVAGAALGRRHAARGARRAAARRRLVERAVPRAAGPGRRAARHRRRRAHGAGQRGRRAIVGWESDDAWRAVRSWLQVPAAAGAGRERPVAPGVVRARRRGRAARRRRPRRRRRRWCCGPRPAAAYLGVPIARPTLRRFDAEARRRCTEPWPDDAARRVRLAARRWRRHGAEQVELLDRYGLFVRVPARVGARAVPAAAQRVPPLHRRPPPARGGGAAPCELVRDRCAGPTCCSWGRCSTTSARAGPGDHTDNGVVLAETRRATRMGFDPADVDALVDIVRAPPAPAQLSPPGATSTTRPRSRRWPTPPAPRTRSTCWPRSPRPTRSPPVPTAWSDVEGGAARRAWSTARVRAAPPRRRGGDRTTATARDPRLDTFDGTLTVDPRPGGVTLVAPDALGSSPSRWPCSACTRRACAAPAPSPSTASPSASSSSSPSVGREPDWDRVAADLRAALVDAASIREQLAATQRALPAPSPRPTAARPRRPTRVRRQRRHRRRPRWWRCGSPTASACWPASPRRIAGQDLRVDQAFVSTLGHEVVDTFYVTDARRGEACTDPDVLAAHRAGACSPP